MCRNNGNLSLPRSLRCADFVMEQVSKSMIWVTPAPLQPSATGEPIGEDRAE